MLSSPYCLVNNDHHTSPQQSPLQTRVKSKLKREINQTKYGGYSRIKDNYIPIPTFSPYIIDYPKQRQCFQQILYEENDKHFVSKGLSYEVRI